MAKLLHRLASVNLTLPGGSGGGPQGEGGMVSRLQSNVMGVEPGNLRPMPPIRTPFGRGGASGFGAITAGISNALLKGMVAKNQLGEDNLNDQRKVAEYNILSGQLRRGEINRDIFNERLAQIRAGNFGSGQNTTTVVERDAQPGGSSTSTANDAPKPSSSQRRRVPLMASTQTYLPPLLR